MARKVVLDVDTGIDDALAILLALRSPELEVLGITRVAGNVTLDQVVRNTLAVLELAGAEVPVAAGARKPLAANLRTATYFHGRNGIGDIELPQPARSLIREDAASFLMRMVGQHPDEVTIIAVGPLTNVALAMLRDPGFAGDAAGFYLMGGAISTPGNASGAAEANFSNDPEAAAAVADSEVFIHLVDLGATTQAVLTPERLGTCRRDSAVADFSYRLLEFYSVPCRAAGAAGPVLHDPLAVGLAAIEELAGFVPLHLEVETGGTYARGASIGNFAGLTPQEVELGNRRDVIGLAPVPFNAAVAREIDVPRFIDLFLQRLELEP